MLSGDGDDIVREARRSLRPENNERVGLEADDEVRPPSAIESLTGKTIFARSFAVLPALLSLRQNCPMRRFGVGISAIAHLDP